MFRNRNKILIAAIANRNQHIANETIPANALYR